MTGFLLEFSDGFTFLNTKDVSFSQVFKPNQEDGEGLELLKNLDSMRRSTVGKGYPTLCDATYLDKMLQYCQELEALVAKLEPDGTGTALVTQWTSPMAGRPSHYHKVTGLACEMGMATFMYGSALRAAAVQLLASAAASTSTASPPTSSGGTAPSTDAAPASAATAAADASTLLRKAAGVFQWLNDRGLPRVAHKLPLERPAELIMSMSKVMSQVSLAEAQTVAAVRAEQRGVSPVLVSALHAGAWELWENAAKALKAATADYVSLSDHLRRYLASSAAVCRARALKALATDLRVNKEEAGQAEAACVFAASLLNAAHVAADVNAAWRQVAMQEGAALEETRIQCQRDRENVYYQSIARNPPDLPTGKILVTLIPFSLTSTTPASMSSDATPAGSIPQDGSAAVATHEGPTLGEGAASADQGAAAPTSPGAPKLASALNNSLVLRDK